MSTTGHFTSSKTFRGFPCAHRRWRHEGHCAHVHGYDRTFIIWFAAHERTENGFVMDFGQLKPVKNWLEQHFDHTLLLDEDDPLLPEFRALEAAGACTLITFDDVGMEGTAQFVYRWVDAWVRGETEGRVWVTSVEVCENEKNSARFSIL